MKCRIDRMRFLQSLESVELGLTPGGAILQSDCFVFRKGWVVTFNNELSCRAKTELDPSFTGVVRAKMLLESMRACQDESLAVRNGNGRLAFRGHRRESSFMCDPTVSLPIDTVEKPGEWKKVPLGFVEAVASVSPCLSKDETFFWTNCLHVSPAFVEACDRIQMARHEIQLPFRDHLLIHRQAVRQIVSSEPSHVSETENWIHFRSYCGTIFSCRVYREEYPDLSKVLSFRGGGLKLPKGLVQSVEFANIFSSENRDDNKIRVELSKGRVKIVGEGATARGIEVAGAGYKGPEMVFFMAPKVFSRIVEKYERCEIGRGDGAEYLRAGGDSWNYVTALGSKVRNKEEGSDE